MSPSLTNTTPGQRIPSCTEVTDQSIQVPNPSNLNDRELTDKKILRLKLIQCFALTAFVIGATLLSLPLLVKRDDDEFAKYMQIGASFVLVFSIASSWYVQYTIHRSSSGNSDVC